MPREIKEIKDFLLKARRKDAKFPLCSHNADYMDSLHEFVAL